MSFQNSLLGRGHSLYCRTIGGEGTTSYLGDKALDHDISAAGELEFLLLTLDDLSSIKASAEAFKSKEQRLDVLFNNAGVFSSQESSLTIQSYERQLATNCLGPYLFTQLLLLCYFPLRGLQLQIQSV